MATTIDRGRRSTPTEPTGRGRRLGRCAPPTAAFARRRRRRHAEGPLRPLAAHHHHAGRAAAGAGRLRLHGAPLAGGDRAPVGGDGRRHRRDRRHDRDLPAGRQVRPRSPRIATDRFGLEHRHPAARAPAAGRAEAVLLAARPRALARDHPADRQAVLDRHGRPLQPRRDPHPARRQASCASSPRAARPTPPTR